MAFSLAIALARFWSWLRSSWQATTTPVGRWVMRIADDGLVHVLATGARRPEGVDADVLVVDLDLVRHRR